MENFADVLKYEMTIKHLHKQHTAVMDFYLLNLVSSRISFRMPFLLRRLVYEFFLLVNLFVILYLDKLLISMKLTSSSLEDV